MKQQIQLQIPSPCHENWDKMTGTEHGRFCMSCQKEVVDFSVLTDKQIIDYISRATESICGRVQHDQMNRDLIQPREVNRIGWRHWMSVAASVIMAVSGAASQGKTPKQLVVSGSLKPGKKIPVIIKKGELASSEKVPEKIMVRGKIVDERNNPIPYATITQYDATAGVAADAEGNFILFLNEALPNIKLSASAVGFATAVIELDTPEKMKSITTENNVLTIEVATIVLTQALMEEVVITSRETKGRMIAGAMLVCKKVTTFEKVKKIFNPANEVQVVPNPVATNRFFNVRFRLKDQGGYNVQFTDAAGKIIASRPLVISSGNQVENFNGNMFSTAGIYFVTVFNKQAAKMYTSKILVQ
ncbi:MAG: carboxypeptidase-like regulatory domain-containing protein [Chitinophagaceae bacterium]